MLRYWTAGESHGPALIALVDGFPAGLAVDTGAIDAELVRRQGGYGRGGRQRIETDAVRILSGLWRGTTLGSPLALEVVNKDAKLERLEEVDRPRPGHADLPGWTAPPMSRCSSGPATGRRFGPNGGWRAMPPSSLPTAAER